MSGKIALYAYLSLEKMLNFLIFLYLWAFFVKFHAEISWALKKFYNLPASFLLLKS